MIKPRVKKDGKYTYYIVSVDRKTSGHKIYERFTNKKDAKKFCIEVEDRIAKNKGIVSNRIDKVTFGEAVEKYLSGPILANNRRPLSPRTITDRKYGLIKLTNSGFSTIPLGRFNVAACESLFDDLQYRFGWSSKSRYNYESHASSLFNFAKKQKWMGHNPIMDEDYERLNDSKSRNRTYTSEERDRLLAAADDEQSMLSLFLRIAFATGARSSEISNLLWDDIQPSDYDGVAHSLFFRNTKNGSDRKVFIGEDLTTFLNRHEQQFRQTASPFVFPAKRIHRHTKTGAVTTHYKAYEEFRKARVKAGLDEPDPLWGERLSIHHIRHTWATELGAKGASLTQLMSAGGWKSASMVTRYMKLQEQQAAEATLLLLNK